MTCLGHMNVIHKLVRQQNYNGSGLINGFRFTVIFYNNSSQSLIFSLHMLQE